MESSAYAATWTVISRVIGQLAQLVLIILAARLAGPAEFGAFALASAAAIGLVQVAAAGWREYIAVARSERDRVRAHTCSLVSGIGGLLVGLTASAAFSMVSDDRYFLSIIILLSIWVTVIVLQASQAGLLMQRGKVGLLARIQIAGECAGFASGFVVLVWGGGVLGLAVAKLACDTTNLLLSMYLTRWARFCSIRKAFAGEIILFSRQIMITRLVQYAHGNASLFLVGAFFGLEGAGIFRAGVRIVGALHEIVSETVRRLSWSGFGLHRGQDQASAGAPDLVGASGVRLLSMSFVLAAPLFVGLALTAPRVTETLLGAEWADAAEILSLLALSRLLLMPMTVTEALLAVRGRLAVLQYLTIAATLLTLASLAAFSPFGLVWAAASQVFAAALILPLIIWVHERIGGLRWKEVVASTSFGMIVALLGMIGAVAAVGEVVADWQGPAALAVQVAAGAMAYVAILLAVAPRHFADLRGSLRGISGESAGR